MVRCSTPSSALLSLVLLLTQSNGGNGFTTTVSPSVRTVPTTSANSRSTTRQYAFFGGKEKTRNSTREDVASTTKTTPTATTTKNKMASFPSLRPKQQKVNTKGMPDLELDLEKEETEMAMSLADAELSLEKLLVPLGLAGALSLAAMKASSMGLNLADVTDQIQAFQADPQGTLQASLDGLGPLAVVYFGALYVVAELLAIPATPLTLTSGYLFGLTEGTLVVLAAGTISACIGFVIGKTFLRGWVETVLDENPKFKKLDNAIGAEGFKLLVLVRCSPIFPFALLNYTYGASSISFPTFVAGTLLGFTPSTLGYVYTGLVGKELMSGDSTQPWYVYAAGVTVLLGFLKLVTDVATQVVEAIDEEE